MKETSSVIFIFASLTAVRIEADNAVAMLTVLVTRLTRPEGGKHIAIWDDRPTDLPPNRFRSRLLGDPSALQAATSA